MRFVEDEGIEQSAPANDQYYAIFSRSPGFRSIKVETGDVIRVVLHDADLSTNDGIGVMELTSADVARAR